MKTILITFIAAIALTHVATAGNWAWYRGDIGVGSSPFISSVSEQEPSAGQAATKRSVSTRAKAAIKSKGTDQRVTAR